MGGCDDLPSKCCITPDGILSSHSGQEQSGPDFGSLSQRRSLFFSEFSRAFHTGVRTGWQRVFHSGPGGNFGNGYDSGGLPGHIRCDNDDPSSLPDEFNGVEDGLEKFWILEAVEPEPQKYGVSIFSIDRAGGS